MKRVCLRSLRCIEKVSNIISKYPRVDEKRCHFYATFNICTLHLVGCSAWPNSIMFKWFK